MTKNNNNKFIKLYVNNNHKGVSIIALVVTIIILIILASITISSLLTKGLINITIKTSESHGIESAKEKLLLKLSDLKAEAVEQRKNLTLEDLIIINSTEKDMRVETTKQDEDGNEIEEKVVRHKEDGKKDYINITVDGYKFEVNEDFEVIYINQKTDPKEEIEKDQNYEGIEDDHELKEDEIILDSDMVWDENADKVFLDSVPKGWIGIYNETDLINMNSNLSGKYILMNDITLAKNWIPIGNENEEFKGYFNGNGYTIANLKINSNKGYVGMFGRTAGGVCITNLTLKNYAIVGEGNYIGSVVRIQ